MKQSEIYTMFYLIDFLTNPFWYDFFLMLDFDFLIIIIGCSFSYWQATDTFGAQN